MGRYQGTCIPPSAKALFRWVESGTRNPYLVAILRKTVPTFSGKCSNALPSVGRGRLRHWRAVVWAAIVIAMPAPSAVRAVDAVNISVDAPAIDLTDALERPKGDGDRVQVSTAADAEGIVR